MSYISKKLILSKLIFLFALIVYGQDSKVAVYGKVKDYKSKRPLSSVTITVIGADSIPAIVSTDDKGNYLINKELLKSGKKFILTCETRYKYHKKTQTLDLRDAAIISPVKIDFELYPVQMECFANPRVNYEINSAELKPESKVMLDGVVAVFNDNPGVVIEVSGHADFREKDPLKLSEERAAIVMAYLIENGIDTRRIIPIGYGDAVYYTIEFDYKIFKKGDVLDKQYVNALTDPELIEETIHFNGATFFKVLRNNFQAAK